MRIILPRFGPIALKRINPENLLGPSLKGTDTFFCKEEFGTITLQEFTTENYSIRLAFFNLVKKISLIMQEDSPFMKGVFALKGSFFIKSKSSPKLKLRKGQYLFYSTDKTHSLLEFEKEDQYQIFESSFSKNLLENFFETFPSIKDYIESSRNLLVAPQIEKPHFISPESKKIIHQLLHCPYDQNLRKLYFENKVNDLLFETLTQVFNSIDRLNKLTEREAEAVFNARKIILQDVTKHYTVRNLSSIVNLGQLKLKTGFKQTFGVGLFEYLVQARMEKAYQLITQTNKPIKEIASETGFVHVANFITSFGKHFGKTPGELRKQ